MKIEIEDLNQELYEIGLFVIFFFLQILLHKNDLNDKCEHS